MGIIFLTLQETLKIHRDQILRYGGICGIRDINLLLSALAMPSTTFDQQFLHEEIHDMAAAYLFHLVKNHPFIDGNKRVGAVAAFVFLALNGYELNAPEDEYADMVFAVARNETDKRGVANFFRCWIKRVSSV